LGKRAAVLEVSTMTNGPRDRFFGNSIDEWISTLPGELAVDAVGLWQIVSFGREGFGLSGDRLTDFVRRGIEALFVKGATPVVGAMNGIHLWTTVDYGDSSDVASKAIIAEWQSSGRDPDVGDVWFALPHIFDALRPLDAPRRRKEDLS
jgi:hypothetical protein